MTAEVVVYGASGNTGKLVCWKLAERGIPFIAAGRNKQRLEEQMAKVPELEGADYECVAVEHTEEALGELLKGKKVMCNMVGPFMQLGEPVVRACLENNVHYIDTTGEQDFMRFVEAEYGQAFKEKDLMLAPATSMMWASGAIAAEIALETPGIDTVDILYSPSSTPSVASTMSFLRMCCQPQFLLENNELVEWPSATAYSVQIPGMHRARTALPWSGGGEPIWYATDDRIRNCTVMTAFNNDRVMEWAMKLIKEFDEKYKDAPREEQERVTNEWGNQISVGEPERENEDIHRTVVSCYARGKTQAVSVILWGTCGYIQTGSIQAITTQALLEGKAKEFGFVNPARAIGARQFVNELSEEGLHCEMDKINNFRHF